MSWPLASHFSAMLQNPRVAFRDPALKQCRVEKDRCNQPRPWSGAFAVVYKGMPDDGGDPFALRVFTTESPERRERYELASAYLKTRRLSCLVDFEYRDESIRSAGDGKWYPLIVMEWVEGETLFHWVRARCLEGDWHALAEAAAGWVELVKELADARIAHGDLQDANVMVTSAGRLKLVDYDCMCVPALVGRRNLEVGVEPYQHPDRSETTHLSLDLDSFSALVIYVALRALAVDPTLWTRYVEKPSHDKLLFRTEDFEAPRASPLYRDLTALPAQDVRNLTDKLFSLWRARMDQVPSLVHLTNSYAEVEELLRNERWEAAVQLLNRRGQFRDAPEHLKPLIHQAYEYVCRKQAWDAFVTVACPQQAGSAGKKLPDRVSELDDRKLVNAWNEVLFGGFEPAERERPRVMAARKRVTVLDRLHHMVQRSSRETSRSEERGIALAAKHLPKGYQYSLRPRVEAARQRLDAISQLERALQRSGGEAAIAGAWRKVVAAQCTRFVRAEDRPRIDLAEKRFAMIEALQRVPENLPPDQLDRRLLDVWNEELAEGCEELEAWRTAYEWALYRKQLLDRIEGAIRAGDDAAVIEVVEDPALENYALPVTWTTAIRMARKRVTRTETLVAALESEDRSSFVDLFDARLMRKCVDRFAPYESLLSEWTRWEILPLEGLGLGPALGRASLFCIDKAEGTYRVRWTWPQARFTDQCILAVCAHEPQPDDDPRDLDVLYRLPVDRRNWESGGGSRVIHVKPEWKGGLVVVWAMVDLGFRVLASEPLVLGRLDGGRGLRRGAGRRWQVRKLLSSLRKDKTPPPAQSDEAVEPSQREDAIEPSQREDAPP